MRGFCAGECVCFFGNGLWSEFSFGDEEADFECRVLSLFDGGAEEAAEPAVVAVGGERSILGVVWVVEEGDGVALSVDGCAFSEPWKVTRFFRIGVGAGEDVGGGGGIDAHGGSELEAGVFGIAVEFGVAGDGGDDGCFIDLYVAVGGGLGYDEGPGFVEERGAFGGFPEDACFQGSGFVGGVFGEEFLMDLVAALHVPAVEGTGESVDGDFHPTDVDAAVVGEAATCAFGDGRGAFGVHDVEEGFVGFVQTLWGAFVVGVLVSGEDLSFEKDVEVVAGCVGEGEVGGVRLGEAEQQGGQEEGVGVVHGFEGGLWTGRVGAK